MRNRLYSRVLPGLLALLLAASLLPVSQAVGGSISAAAVTLEEEIFNYDGSAHSPAVTVILDGKTLQPGTDYETSYQNNTRAGTATVTVTGTGDHTGSVTRSFTIRPRTLTEADLTFAGCTKPYDGNTAAQPEITVKTVGGDQVTVTATAAYADKFAGTNKAVTITNLTLTGRDSGNYKLGFSGTRTLTNGQITPQIPAVGTTAEVTAGGTLDLTTLISGTASRQGVLFDTDVQPQGGALTTEGLLTAGTKAETLRILVTISPYDANGDGIPEYAGVQKTITVNLIDRPTQAPIVINDDKDDSAANQQSALSFTGRTTVTYGETLKLAVTGGSGSGAVVYTVKSITGDATIDQTGVLTPKKAGKVWVTAQKQGDGTYAAGDPVSVEVVIEPIRLTITAHNKTAVVGERVPYLTLSDYTVTGLLAGDHLKVLPKLSYATTPDMTRPGTVAIQATGAVGPDGGNYSANITYVPGTLTIRTVAVYAITVRPPANGTLTADKQTAQEGERVTVTVKPNQGYACQSVTAAAAGKTLRATRQTNGTYTFSMPAGDVTLTAVFQKEEQLSVTPTFSDVKPTDWFYDSVLYAAQHGLMNGTGDGKFSPTLSTSRGMIVTILYRLSDSPEAPKRNPFTDVASGAYYTDAVAWAAWNGIVTGYDSSTFGPNDPITREQMAAILYRYARFQGYDVSGQSGLTGFADASAVHNYARVAMAWANRAGLITGKDGNRLDPLGRATRAEVAAILQRFCVRYL